MQEVYNKVGQFFTDLLSIIFDWAIFLLSVVQQIFFDLIEMLTDIPVWIFEQILQLVTSIIDELPFPEAPNYWAGLPEDLINILTLIGLPECLALLLTALTIRILLQLIPFTSLGS